MNEELKSAVDELHNLRKDKAVLSEREDALKKFIAESGLDSLDGYVSTASVRRAVQKQIDYKGLVSKLKVSVQRITAHTKHVPYVRIQTREHSRVLLNGTPGYRPNYIDPSYIDSNYRRANGPDPF